MVRALRKPLIIMTPKSLLRHALVGVAARGTRLRRIHNVIDDVDDIKPSAVTRIVLCTGKCISTC